MCVFVHNSALIVVAENSTQHFHIFSSLGRQFGKIIKMYIYLLDLTSSRYFSPIFFFSLIVNIYRNKNYYYLLLLRPIKLIPLFVIIIKKIVNQYVLFFFVFEYDMIDRNGWKRNASTDKNHYYEHSWCQVIVFFYKFNNSKYDILKLFNNS